jgi:hypothetical protein
LIQPNIGIGRRTILTALLVSLLAVICIATLQNFKP